MQEMLDLRKRRNEPGPSRGVLLGPGPSDASVSGVRAYALDGVMADVHCAGGYTVEWQLDSGEAVASSS